MKMNNTIQYFSFREKLLDIRQDMRFCLQDLYDNKKEDLAKILENDLELLNNILFEKEN